MAHSQDITHVARLENVIVNVRDAGGRGRAVREFLLVFPGLLTNTCCQAVMRMIEYQLKQKLRQLSLGGPSRCAESRLVLAGAGMTVVSDVGGSFESALNDEGEEVQNYVPDNNQIELSTHAATFGTGEWSADLDTEPVQWKQFGGFCGLYNLLDGSLIDESWTLNHPGKGLEDRDINAMSGFKYALLEAQLFCDERIWAAFDAQPRKDNQALKVAVRGVGDGQSSGQLGSPVDMAVRVLAQGVPDELKPHTAKVVAEIEAAVETVAGEMGADPDEQALRAALVSRLHTLKRTVHFKAYHPDRQRVSGGLNLEHATTMAAWLEEVYSYILRRRLGDGGGGEAAQVVVERK